MPGNIECGQGAGIDAGLVCASYPDHHGWQIGGPGQGYAAQVRPVGVPVIRGVEISAGVAEQSKPVNREFGARGVVLTRGIPGQVRGDFRTGKPWIGDHPLADDVAEFDH